LHSKPSESENPGLVKKLADEKTRYQQLAEENRLLRLKTQEGLNESQNRQLFECKLHGQRLQFELQKASAVAVHLKSKVKRLKIRGSPAPGREVKMLEEELSSLRTGYEMAVEYIHSTQEKLLESRNPSEKPQVRFGFQFAVSPET
jgi:hypothetical protein